MNDESSSEGTMTTRTAIIRDSGEGDAIWFNSDLFTFKATSEETDHAFTLFEELSQRGKVTPLHVHPEADETFYVLEGEIVIFVAGEERRVGAGGMASCPRGIPHALMVTSEVARLLTIVTPGYAALEQFFRDVGEPATAHALPPSAPLPLEKIRAAAMRHGSVVILGPPPFAAAAAAH
ncbi:MAG: cupin protein [Gemmatimonadetes bacterium]|nr:cupin protein [Gemmatimonadota bacterium]